MIPDPLIIALLSLGGVALTVCGAIVGHLLSARASARTATVQTEANKRSNEQQMIDQLQEELSGYRAAADARAAEQDRRTTVQDERMERLEHRAEGYRDYAHTLRAHIYNELPPPPPAWPDGLPR